MWMHLLLMFLQLLLYWFVDFLIHDLAHFLIDLQFKFVGDEFETLFYAWGNLLIDTVLVLLEVLLENQFEAEIIDDAVLEFLLHIKN